MRLGAVILGISISAVLLAVAVYFYVMADNGGGRHYDKSIDLVRQMQVLSSDWSVEITRVRSDPFSDFDSLAAFVPRMARFKEKLSQHAQRIPDLPDRIADEISAYLSAIEAKEERVERFKTGYAVVRNSKRYFPLAAASVLRQAEESRNDALVRSISRLTRDVNLHLAAPTKTAKIRLTAEIEALRRASVDHAPSLAHAVENLLAHSEVLVEKQGPTNELFRDVTSNEVTRAADRLAGNLEFELGRAAVLAAYYEYGILATIGVLVVFWIVLALQQRLPGRSIAGEAAPQPPTLDTPFSPARGGTTGEFDPAATQPTAPAPPVAAEPPGTAAEPSSVPAQRDPDAVLQNGFVVKCVAGVLASSAEEIADRMDFLRNTHRRINDALQHGDSGGDASIEAKLGEHVDAISAVAASVRQRINGIADLAKRLESFCAVSADEAERSMIDINACIENVIAAAAGGTRASIVKNLGDVPRIFASEAELHMVVAELVENSAFAVRDLTEKKGIIKIDSVRKDDEILITVIDNGVGIAPDRRRSIFKPFFTSRDGAMGIGLALAGHLVGKYEGTIRINSLPGQGTVARVTLPALRLVAATTPVDIPEEPRIGEAIR